MSNNKNMNDAKVNKYDEFYTDYNVVQKEMNHYTKQFENKTVFCNCDDPFESSFCRFFLKNFNFLKLRRLICTSYAGSKVLGTQMTLFDDNGEKLTEKHGYVMDITEIPMENGRGVSDSDIERLLKSPSNGVKKLNGSGDFRSKECIEYLKQSDIVVTNPPFSLFREFVQQLLDFKKQFLIIGNLQNIGYENVLKAFMDGKIWIGYDCSSKTYRVPDSYSPEKSFVKDGVRYSTMGNTLWYTNLEVSTRNDFIDLYKNYNSDEYPKYVNYDAIEVPRVKLIPKDYYGPMGVPTSFIEFYNPKQFKIIGTSQSLVREISDDVKKKGKHAQIGRFFVDNHDGTYEKKTERIVIIRIDENDED